MPFLRKPRDGIALGGQQAQRLQQLRLVSDKHIHEQHLDPLEAAKSPRCTRQGDVLSPTFGHSARASRTVEAIIESRTIDKDDDAGPSKATRLRETIRGARGGFHTERSDETRPRTTLPVAQKTVSRPTTHALGSKTTRATSGFTQRIAAVRRRRVGDADASQRRKLTREELEWIEKQLQFTQRVGLLEKECAAWWQSFYASAASTTSGSATIESSEETRTTTLAIQKQVEESDRRRRQDTQELQQQLHGLRQQADAAMDMVCRMRDGADFVSELQDAMDAFERDLSRFRVTQREKFDSYVLEEKLLERDLTAFLDKVDSWEQQEQERKKAPKSAAKTKKAASGLNRSASGVREEPEGVTDQPQEVPGRGDVDLFKRVRMLNQQILESGGLKGGWDDREHAVFASVLLKYGLTDEVVLANHVANAGENQQQDGSVDYETLVARAIRKCVQGVVTKTENAVRNHFDWYLGHLRLVQEKKDTIAQWKHKKETERQQLIRQGLHQVDTDHIGGSTSDDLAAAESPNRLANDAVVKANETKKTKRMELLEAKEREKKARELEKWRDEKERRANEEQEQERDKRAQREAREAKKRQGLLEKKQQLLLYKLQKEQETSMLQRNRSAGGGGGSNGSPPGSQSPGPSNEELMERSRKAIEQAKAKRAQLQAMEERRLKQQELPERPKSVAQRKASASGSAASPTDSEGSPSGRDQTLLKPTKAFEARHLTKLELKRKEKERATQGAHDAYFPGAGMISDVKIKSFGHIAIAPRAVPSWRRNV